MNAGKISEMDPYKEVSQQGQAHPLSAAYVPDPMELDAHVKDDDEDPEEDPNEEREPEDEDTKEPSKGSDETEHPAYDQAQLGSRAAMIHRGDDIFEEDMPPQRRFALTGPPPGCNVAESSAAAARHLGASERRMMTSIEEVNLRVSYQAQVRRQESANFYTHLHDAQTDHRDIRLEIDVVRGQKTAYETEPQEVHQAYLTFEAQNRAPLARLETLETHMSHMKWQRQSAKDLAVTQMMCIHTLEDRARADTVEDTDSSSIIDWAIQRNSTHTQDDASQSSGGGIRRPVQPTRVCSYTDFMKCQPLNFKGTEGIVGLSQWLEKMESVFHISGCANDNQVKFATCTLLGAALTWWNGQVRTLGHDAAYAMTWGTLKKKLMDKYYPKGEIKKQEIELWNLRVKGNDVAAYTQYFQELALTCTKFLANETEKVDKYIRRLPDNIHGNVMNGSGNGIAQGRVYALGGRDSSPDSNVIMGMFLLNNRYAKILLDTGADSSFVSTTFSALIDITPTTLENHYDVELADGKIIGIKPIIRGRTLNFMNHPFNIDLMSVPLGSFDVIIGMDWLRKYHGVIICNEKIVCVPFGREMLIFQGNGDNQREESRLNIISCIKAQEYLSKGCDVFLANVTMKEAKDKSEGKRLEDVPIVRDFPEVFPEDLPGIPPARPVEF
nr:reverse transcriptase domain-containing protein [Tanacetum cinerariifolium]